MNCASKQILQNLLQNAVRYSPAGGQILVELSQQDRQAYLRVTDHGVGIPAEALPKLFQRFYRAPNAAKEYLGGLGVGLFLVKSIVELHGGTVAVESTEGRGSTFAVRLPLALDVQRQD